MVEKRRRRRRRHRTCKIEQLPDDVLLLILSNLTLVDVVRTSTLSRRWKNIWRYNTCLDFDATTLHPLNKIDNRRKWYVAWVNKFIKARENMPGLPSVKELRIRCTLRNRKARHIDRWIDFAIANRVETLHLDFYGYNRRKGRHGPDYILSEESWLNAPTGLSSLKCLKSLLLSCVNASQQFIELVLSSCPLLEDLSLHSVGIYTHLNVSDVPPLPLRRLSIEEYPGPVITNFHAPLLPTFSYKCSRARFKAQKNIDVPMLTDLTIDSRFNSGPIMKCLEYFWSYLPQLEKLDLIMGYELEFELKKPTEELVNLKYLKMHFYGDTDDITDQILNFMSACPVLSTLAIEIYEADDDLYYMPTLGSPLDMEWDMCFKCLKVLEMYCSDEESFDEEFVSCILSKSPNLEKLMVYTRLHDTISSSPMFRSSELRLVEKVQAKAKKLCRRSHRKIELTVFG